MKQILKLFGLQTVRSFVEVSSVVIDWLLHLKQTFKSNVFRKRFKNKAM